MSNLSKDLVCAGTEFDLHPSAAHQAACPLCNPTKTVPELNRQYALTSNQLTNAQLLDMIEGIAIDAAAHNPGKELVPVLNQIANLATQRTPVETAERQSLLREIRRCHAALSGACSCAFCVSAVETTSVTAPIESFPMRYSCFLHGDHPEEQCPKCPQVKAAGDPP